MLYTIYQVTHLESGKCYIGKHQTENPNDGYMGSGQLIRRAVTKHGSSSFKKEVLHVFETESEMNAKEAELVTEEFCARDDTYNLCPGGNGGWGYVNASDSNNKGWKHNSLTRSHQINGGLKTKGKDKYNEAFRLAGAKSFLGKTHTDETKFQMSQSQAGKQLGKRNSQFGTIWITDGTSNRKIPNTNQIPNGWNLGRTTGKGLGPGRSLQDLSLRGA